MILRHTFTPHNNTRLTHLCGPADAQTPDIPNDGRAFFGRDAMANYMLIGAKQLGCTIFDAQDGSMTLNFDHDAVRTLWDNYYVPFIKGYFSASGRFRSDDVKTGNIIAYVGSSSSATFFPTQVIADDMDSHDITRKALESPKFANGEDYAVQQGAGMVVTKASDAEIQASLVFLKWFTSPEHNITFSVDSGYLPVTHEGNSTAIAAVAEQIAPAVQARRTDRLAPAEGFDPQAATVQFRQQGLPLVPTAP